MNKPREWWIQEGHVDYACKRPGDKQDLPRIHVIEKSAYDRALEEIRWLRRELNTYVAKPQRSSGQP
jgi:hypothetical protein